ncbi:TetR/AcrR family transcriptional regulator [Kitasatospora kifunensis]|uniref:AcrR family transcriptional regulator n=1 Tax=Kitasatospora kifunensis TaxID=58351 RepID=A0A7W7R849_KITKI|nr:TetR/AcrR family transcriptional regulator C-terminal domain-containing protein [Kitasatospora kifunensis]MBB4927212.1 AcrR family transcriptional regulator [Kitasatospora kifunensis]
MSTPPRAKAGRPPQIGREDIITTSVRVIDADGLDALTMRRIGAELDVTAMSLYRYLPNRDAVLAAVADRLIGEAAFEVDPGAPWPEALRRFALAYRRMLMAHPRAAPLLATHPVDLATGRALIAPALERLRAAGIPEEDGVAAVESVGVYLLGHALAQVGPPSGAGRVPRQGTADGYERCFNAGLNAMLAGFQQQFARV